MPLLSLSLMMLAAAPAASPTPGDLLLSLEARNAFSAKWAGAVVRVRYRDVPPGADAEGTPWRYTLAARVEAPRGVRLLAPEHLLAGADEVELVLDAGAPIPVELDHPEDATEVPLAVLELSEPEQVRRFAGRPALKWRVGEVEPETRAWGFELVEARMPDGLRLTPVLVDTVVGGPVEHPLERFFYVGVHAADGMPLLDATGALVCVVFRQVPGAKRSLCTPQDAALSVPAPEAAEGEGDGDEGEPTLRTGTLR